MTVDSIHARMVAILEALPAIGKTQQNQQQKFMYRGHDDVLNALNPLLAKHGVFVVPTVLDRQVGSRTTNSGSTMYEVNLLVAYRFYGLAGDYVEASAWGEGTDMGDKSTNKAMTMAFKNVLAQAFAISTAELSDSDGESPEQTSRNRSAGVGPESPPPAPAGFPLPTSWSAVQGAMAPYGQATVDDFTAFGVQAREYLYPGKESAGLTAPERKDLLQLTGKAVKFIREMSSPDEIPPPDRQLMRTAWATFLDGVELEGPPWRMSGEEMDREPRG